MKRDEAWAQASVQKLNCAHSLFAHRGGVCGSVQEKSINASIMSFSCNFLLPQKRVNDKGPEKAG
jgi:hypothetical protein